MGSLLWMARSRVAVLSLAFLAAYFGIRAIPVESCDFLHFRDYLNAEGAIEMCGLSQPDFQDLAALRYPVKVRLSPQGPVVRGHPARFDLHLQTERGRALGPSELAVNHTERLHLLVVDEALLDYHHLHPSPLGEGGRYQFSLTPARSGLYRVYLDFVPLRSARPVYAVESFLVEIGDAGSDPALVPPGSRFEQVEDGVAYTLQWVDGPPEVGREMRFRLAAEPLERDGKVLFQPVMGAFAHLVAFHRDRVGLAHLHPLNPFIDLQDPHAPELEFLFRVDRRGWYRIWAQVHTNGHERFIPFDLLL